MYINYGNTEGYWTWHQCANTVQPEDCMMRTVINT